MQRVNQGQTQSEQVEHDETVGGTDGNPHTDSASFAALENINGVATATSTLSVDAPAAVKIDATVKMFLVDKTPRGEALFEYMMESPPVADTIASDPEMLYVIHNESQWDSRNSDPVPDDFSEAYTSLSNDVAALLAYVERFLSDYTEGQNFLDGLVGNRLSAEDLASSETAMYVIQTGDEKTDLQNYRTA